MKKEKNNIKNIQSILMREIARLDDDEYMKTASEKEIRRSNAISNTAQSFIKATNVNIKIFELENKFGKNVKKNVGVEEDE